MISYLCISIIFESEHANREVVLGVMTYKIHLKAFLVTVRLIYFLTLLDRNNCAINFVNVREKSGISSCQVAYLMHLLFSSSSQYSLERKQKLFFAYRPFCTVPLSVFIYISRLKFINNKIVKYFTYSVTTGIVWPVIINTSFHVF